MPPAPHPAISALLSDDLTDDKRLPISTIWYYLKFPDKITETEEWPFKNIVTYHTLLHPNTHLDAGMLPITMATFLCDDIRTMATKDIRLDHAASNMMEDDINNYSLFWVDILYKILVVFTECKQTRGRNVHAKRKAITKHIYECDEEENDMSTMIRTEPVVDEISHERRPGEDVKVISKMDVNKSIQAMSFSIPQSERLTGEETDPFTDRLKTILEQMNAFNVHEEHKSLVLFSLTSGKAREAASKLPLKSISFDEMITSIKKECLYEPSIQERRATRWKNVTYSEFKANSSSEEEATRACVEHVTSLHKDLPENLGIDATLLCRLKDIFKSEMWCESLYKRSAAHQTSHSFSQALITAAANADDSKRNLRDDTLNIKRSDKPSKFLISCLCCTSNEPGER